MANELDIIIGTIWRHKRGKLYQVTGFTNLESTDEEKYPKTVVYRSLVSGIVWSRPLARWRESMEIEVDVVDL